jgi:N-acetylglucosamine kinase-like BadF-type ATPase
MASLPIHCVRSSTVKKSKTTTAADDLLLVVDAGGSKTAAWLVDTSKAGEECIVGRGRASAGNPLSIGFSESTRAILEAIAAAQDDAQRNGQASRAMLSIAGAANPRLRDHFLDWAQSEAFATQIAVVPDVLPVLAAGTANCCGVALVAGTGSVALARSADGRTTICGGWGYLLGDEGSGYAIGRAALRRTLECMESKSPHTPLVRAVLEKTTVNSVMELTKAMYEQPFPRTAIAAIAPLVVELGEAGEDDAQVILDEAAHDLAKLVQRAVRCPIDAPLPLGEGQGEGSQELGATVTLAASGGVLVSSPRLQQSLKRALQRSGLALNMRVVDEPLEGCVKLANADFAASLVQWQ